MPAIGVLVFIISVCLIFSFLFSGIEAGVFAVNRLRIRQLARSGKRSAKTLLGFMEDPENFLWTILVGNTLANFFALWLVAEILHQWLSAHPVWLVLLFGVFTLLLYALGDLLPKMLFQRIPNRLGLALAEPFRLVRAILSPLVWLLTWCSRGLLRFSGGKAFTGRLFGNREELRLVMQESSQGLTSEERTMINRVLDLQNLTVRQIMLALDKAVIVTVTTPVKEVLRLCRELNLTRLLVSQVTGGRQRIVGLVSLKTLLYRPTLDVDRPAGEHLKPALFLEEGLRLEDALRRMQKGGQRLAIVLGRDRREIGIITLEDILKAIFGEVRF